MNIEILLPDMTAGGQLIRLLTGQGLLGEIRDHSFLFIPSGFEALWPARLARLSAADTARGSQAKGLRSPRSLQVFYAFCRNRPRAARRIGFEQVASNHRVPGELRRVLPTWQARTLKWSTVITRQDICHQITDSLYDVYGSGRSAKLN